MPRTFRRGPFRAVADGAIGAAVRMGLPAAGLHLLTTTGRRTGRQRTTPVQLVNHDGSRWLVAPYGEVSWVHNARAAGRVTISRGRSGRDYLIREATPAEAAPVLKKYVTRAPVVLPYFEAGPTAPLEDFAAEAQAHPVFELLPAD